MSRYLYRISPKCLIIKKKQRRYEYEPNKIKRAICKVL